MSVSSVKNLDPELSKEIASPHEAYQFWTIAKTRKADLWATSM